MESERNKSAFTWTWYGVGMDLVCFGGRGKREQAAMMPEHCASMQSLPQAGDGDTRAASDKDGYSPVSSNGRAPPLAAN